MKRKITTILLTMLLASLTAIGLCACDKECKHEYGEWTETKSATCTVAGEKVHTCSKCGNDEKQNIAARGHDMQSVSAKAATCEAAGWNAYEQCSRCDHNTKQVIDALGHKFSDKWTSDENGHWHVCTHDGCEVKSNEAAHSERNHYCSVCDYVTSEHTYGTAVYTWNDDNSVCTATRTCTSCAAETEGHTQTANGVMTSIVKQNATCTLPELTTVTATFAESWTTMQTKEGVQTKDKLEHSYATTWTTDENGHWHACTNVGCAAKSNETTHTDENIDHKCDVCEYITSEHTYGNVVYTWNDNNTECAATGTCSYCQEGVDGHTQTANATVTNKIEQERTCYQPQLTTYTATFTEDWTTTQIKENVQTLEAAEHSPEETWKTDTTHHWKNCIYSGCTEKMEYEQHSYGSDGTCKCGAEETNVFNVEYDSAADGYKITKYKGARIAVTVPSTYDGPNGVKPILSVGNGAFLKSSVTKVVFEEGILSIGDSAFEKCASLISVELPSTLMSIGDNAFYQCGLTRVVLPDSVTSVGTRAFGFCNSLTSVVLSKKLSNIAQRTFQSCALLQSVTIPGSVTSIGGRAFFECTSLTSVVIENGVTDIGALAFADCSSLQSIVIPDSVTSIDTAILRSCNNVEKLSMPSLCKLHDLFDSNGNTVSTALTEVSITSGDELFTSMFKGAASLKNVTISSTIKKIGDTSFSNCAALENIYYTGTAAELVGMSFSNTAVAEIFNQHLYVLNGGGTYEKPTEIEIPDTMTELNYYFCGLNSLESITVPASIKKIIANAFLKYTGLTGLKNLYYKGTLEDWCGIEFENNYSNPINNTGSLLFWNGNSYESLTDIVIPETVTKIGNYQFYELGGVDSVTVPSSVKSIGKLAFYGCSAKTVKITADGTSIGDSVFMRCTSLTTAEISGNVTRMGSGIFNYATGLKTVTLPTGIANFDAKFFTQTSVSTIYFCGTEAEWEAIEKADGWDSWTKTLATRKYTLICSDTVTE